MRKPRVINRKEETNTNYQDLNPKGPGSCVEYQYTAIERLFSPPLSLLGQLQSPPTTTLFFPPVRSS